MLKNITLITSVPENFYVVIGYSDCLNKVSFCKFYNHTQSKSHLNFVSASQLYLLWVLSHYPNSMLRVRQELFDFLLSCVGYFERNFLHNLHKKKCSMISYKMLLKIINREDGRKFQVIQSSRLSFIAYKSAMP